jgi:hypothetical protein
MTHPGDWDRIFAVAYLAVAIEAFLASRGSHQRRERFFWGSTAATLLAFAAAKEFHLQGLLTDWLRTTAREHRLYASREVVQYSFLLVFFGGALVLVPRLKELLRTAKPSVSTAAVAMAALVAFVLLRAASIHALDPAMTAVIAGLRSGWWVELAGMVVVGIAALASQRGHRAV